MDANKLLLSFGPTSHKHQQGKHYVFLCFLVEAFKIATLRWHDSVAGDCQTSTMEDESSETEQKSRSQAKTMSWKNAKRLWGKLHSREVLLWILCRILKCSIILYFFMLLQLSQLTWDRGGSSQSRRSQNYRLCCFFFLSCTLLMQMERLFEERRLTAGQREDFSRATVGEVEHFSFFSIRMHQSRAVLHEL